MYAHLWKEDMLAKAKREEMEAVLQIERNKEMLKVGVGSQLLCTWCVYVQITFPTEIYVCTLMKLCIMYIYAVYRFTCMYVNVLPPNVDPQPAEGSQSTRGREQEGVEGTGGSAVGKYCVVCECACSSVGV